MGSNVGAPSAASARAWALETVGSSAASSAELAGQSRKVASPLTAGTACSSDEIRLAAIAAHQDAAADEHKKPAKRRSNVVDALLCRTHGGAKSKSVALSEISLSAAPSSSRQGSPRSLKSQKSKSLHSQRSRPALLDGESSCDMISTAI